MKENSKLSFLHQLKNQLIYETKEIVQNILFSKCFYNYATPIT